MHSVKEDVIKSFCVSKMHYAKLINGCVMGHVMWCLRQTVLEFRCVWSEEIEINTGINWFVADVK